MTKSFHPYHMVLVSPWPLLMGMAVLTGMIGFIKIFVYLEYNLTLFSFMFILTISMLWWRDVIRESTYQGFHSSVVLKGLMFGMLLFIVSEIFFFLSFFWTFFHSSLNTTVELGAIWPPLGVCPLNPFQVPLLNTVILLSSGVSVTWAHQAILNEDWGAGEKSLVITWILGIYFLSLQWIEYSMASFGMSDSVFGAIFFMATGFHGFHVIVGTLFLMVMWARVVKVHFSSSHHFGFECAAWYWHFVDVVWLFLFTVVYWWGT